MATTEPIVITGFETHGAYMRNVDMKLIACLSDRETQMSASQQA
jgi:hypothetical protein